MIQCALEIKNLHHKLWLEWETIFSEVESLSSRDFEGYLHWSLFHPEKIKYMIRISITIRMK